MKNSKLFKKTLLSLALSSVALLGLKAEAAYHPLAVDYGYVNGQGSVAGNPVNVHVIKIVPRATNACRSNAFAAFHLSMRNLKAAAGVKQVNEYIGNYFKQMATACADAAPSDMEECVVRNSPGLNAILYNDMTFYLRQELDQVNAITATLYGQLSFCN